jgi:hypothetical protein
MRESGHHECERASERRRTPRYLCGGRAQITRLPSDGAVLQGRLRNLGLGGCFIETSSPLQLGTRTEVLVQVNTLCFRAMSLVRAVRSSSGIGVEFIRLSAGGHHTLAELVVDLERLQILLRQPCFRDQHNIWEYPSQPFTGALLRRPSFSESLAGGETIVVAEPPGKLSPLMARCRSVLEFHPASNILDLFG